MLLTPSSSSSSTSTAPTSVRKNQGQNIQVYVRVRPLNGDEMGAGSTALLSVPRFNQLNVKERSSIHGTKTYTFDHVFDEQSRQEDVYKVVVRPLIAQVLRGYNCTVFAYGQTGTGKTYTMEGLKHFNAGWENDPDAGIIPRALVEIFKQREKMRSEGNALGFDLDKFQIKVSFLELYKEEIFDLLSKRAEPDRKLKIYEKKKGVVWVQDLEERIVRSKEEVLKILEDGSAMRQTAATKMNASSSRSHTIFTVTVNIPIEGEDKYLQGKINLVDLAGSENARRSGAEGERLYEAGIINKSLLTLGNVINDLVRGSSHIPYRESKLTRLLQDSLGGKTKTSIIATVSPASMNVDETQSTLFYANNAKSIKNTPEVNQKVTLNSKVAELQSEVDVLRKQLVEQIDKNGGVFMTPGEKEDLDKKSAELEISTKELSYLKVLVGEKTESIERLESEMTTIKSLLDNVREQLKEKHEANLQLEYVVERQTSTEQKLQAQALSLIEVAKSQEHDLAKLHTSHQRKSALERHNLDVAARLQQRISSNLDEKGSILATTRQLVTNKCDEIITDVGEELQSCENRVKDLEDKCMSHNEVITKNLNETDEKEAKFAELLKESLHSLICKGEEASSLACALANEHHEESTELNGSIKGSVGHVEQKLQTVLTSYNHVVSAMLEKVTNFAAARSAEITKASEEKRQLSEAHSKAKSELKDKIKSTLHKIEDIEKNLEDSSDRVLRLQGELVAEQNNQKALKEQVCEQRQSLASIIELLEPLQSAQLSYESVDVNTINNVDDRVKVMMNAAENIKDNGNTEIREVVDSCSKHTDSCKTGLQSILVKTKAFEESIKKRNKEFTEAQLEIESSQVALVESNLQSMRDHNERVKATAESNRKAIVEDLHVLLQGTKESATSSTVRLKSLKEEVDEKLDQTQALDDVVRSHNERFVSDEHRKDRPSGETPTRVHREYPTTVVQGTPNEERKRAFASSRRVSVDKLKLEDVEEGSDDNTENSNDDDSVFTDESNVLKSERSQRMLTIGSMNDSNHSTTSDIENKCPDDEFTVPSKSSSSSMSSKLRAPKVFGSSQVTTRSRSSSRNKNSSKALNAQN